MNKTDKREVDTSTPPKEVDEKNPSENVKASDSLIPIQKSESSLSRKAVTPQTPKKQALDIIDALKDTPTDHAMALIDGAMRVTQATDKTLMLAHADINRRKHGMWIGAGLGTISVVGGVVILVSAAPAAIGAGLLALGAVCYGATFTIATGQTVTMEDFSKAFNSITNSYGNGSKKIDEGGNEDE